MATLSYEVNFGSWEQAFSGALERVRNLGPALREVGKIGVGLVVRNIEDRGGPIDWPDLSPATLIERARHPNGPTRGAPKQVFSGRRRIGPAGAREAGILEKTGERALTKGARTAVESARPLIWTRALLRSISYATGRDFVDYGSTMVKSWTLFLGSRAGKKPVVPARNPFGMTAADEASIGSAFVRHLFKLFQGGVS